MKNYSFFSHTIVTEEKTEQAHIESMRKLMWAN
jgi:hypothetical protein